MRIRAAGAYFVSTKNQITNARGRNGFLSQRNAALREHVRASGVQEGLGVEPPLLWLKGASWVGSGWEETEGQTLDQVEGSYLQAGLEPLGIPQAELGVVAGESKATISCWRWGWGSNETMQNKNIQLYWSDEKMCLVTCQPCMLMSFFWCDIHIFPRNFCWSFCQH